MLNDYFLQHQTRTEIYIQGKMTVMGIGKMKVFLFTVAVDSNFFKEI
jgi:hypothetical protein